MEELLDNTESEWVTQNGVSGRLFTATNGSGNSIFLPAWGSYECYWSSSLYVSNPAGACSLCFSSENVAWYGRSRFFEHSVRPVAVKNQAAAGLLLNAENFPDANFRAALAEILEISEGDEITAEKIAATTYIDVLRWGIEDSEKISDLTGIEYFTALKQLWCTNNQLTSLDVSKNTALRRLYCDFNQLTLLNVSKNIALIELSCYGNQLTSLDVSKNTELTKLSCGNNRLISLDVSQNTALTELICYLNQLTSLDVSKNTALTWLRCDYNQLASLDVSKNTALTLLYCYYNQLTSLDVSKNTALTTLSCSNNQLTSLDVSKNTALTELRCYSNQIKGKEMDALVASLPTVQSGKFYVIDTQDENEGNVCTKSQVAVAKGKGWTV
ncbi:MAG: leucine-rich repeat domain-containing protein, partial [Prevotella sp.]|nr:leucine-rich repeat domain-containing protein [Prevotella sp.]